MKQKRVNRFNNDEKELLEKFFQHRKVPTAKDCENLAADISDRRSKRGEPNVTLKAKQMKYWFDHRRRIENHGTYKPLRPGTRKRKASDDAGAKGESSSHSSGKDEAPSVALLRNMDNDVEERRYTDNLPKWLNSFQLLPLLSQMQYKKYEKGAVIIMSGDYTDDMYFILKGKVEVLDQAGARVAVLEGGQYFGEMGAIESGPRTATVVTATQCHLSVIPSKIAKELVHKEPSANRDIIGKATERLIELMKRNENNPDGLISYPGIMNHRSYEKGSVIIREGDLTDSFYFLSKGTVEVSKQGNPIAVIKESFFGEMAALCPGARTTTITCLDLCEAFELPGNLLRTLVGDEENMKSSLGDTFRQVVFARAYDTMMALTDSEKIRPISPDIAVSSNTMRPEVKFALFQLLKCIHNVSTSF